MNKIEVTALIEISKSDYEKFKRSKEKFDFHYNIYNENKELITSLLPDKIKELSVTDFKFQNFVENGELNYQFGITGEL